MRPQPQKPAETIGGLVERVTFHNDESGFCVLRIKARGHRDLVTVVGTLPEVRAGECLEAQGRWIVNKEYGQQFRAEIPRTMPPTTVEGIEKYLASGMIKGIGPVLAGRVVKAFRERTFEIIDADPHSLTYVDGIGPTRKKKIAEAWAEQKAIREIMVFLHGHKVSTSRAFRIFKAYGNEAIEKVRQDPYRLARDIQGIGFKTADVIAESVGIGKQSDLRARAGVEYTLQELTGEGHCGYGREELVAMAVKLLEIPDEIIQTAVEYLLKDKRIVARTLDSDAGPLPAVFLAGLDSAEKNLAESLIARQAGIQRYGWTFRVGDKVMQMVNDYDKDVFNGDIGRVAKIDEVEQEMTVRFDGRPVKYDFNELDELHLSYATTVHKSQGSEYPVVVLPIHTQHYMMLQRNLIYTATTRSRKLVVLVGTLKALAIAVKNMDARQRVTLLKQPLQAAGGGLAPMRQNARSDAGNAS
jgi:ATP-dependent exoDNAse (exonuclease V) alpha subunit